MTGILMSVDNANISSLSEIQQKESCSLGDEQTPKVRKAYTITKQRERWTDEEHNKFVEALKLHGRAWRQIEEHIGTKTAVQIRSHAQKFFSKVVREPGSGGSCSLQPTEIPPPRPKRKPSRPYPRKLGNTSSKGLTSLKKPERSLSPTQSMSESENRSPTSVLSAIGSDILGSSASNTPKNYGSLDSYATCFNQNGYSLIEPDNMCLACPPPVEGGAENGSPLSGSTFAAMTTEEKSALELDNVCPKEDSSAEAPVTSLKLFGRTLVVNDSTEKSSPSLGKRSNSLKLVSPANKYGEVEEEADMYSSTLTQAENTTQQESSTDSCQVPWKNTWSSVAPPMFYCLPPQREVLNPAQDSSMTPPWWAFYGGLPFPMMQFPSSSSSGIVEKSGDVSELHRKNTYEEEEQTQELQLKLDNSSSASNKPRSVHGNEPKGFLPYKRCSSDRESSKKETSEGQEQQRIRLCL